MSVNYSNIRNEVGNSTEGKVMKALRAAGYWAYNTPKKTNGQPIDIIAVRKGTSFLMDAKHVEEGKVSFAFDRVEPNQITSMMYARDFAGIENLGFAILFERTGIIYWYPFETFMEERKNGKRSVNISELVTFEEVIG